MNAKLEKEIKKEIEGVAPNKEPHSINANDDGTITHIYSEAIEYKDKIYTYEIEWTGINDGEDGGRWSEPYDIREL